MVALTRASARSLTLKLTLRPAFVFTIKQKVVVKDMLDALPVVGHLDDLLVLTITLMAVQDHVTDEARKQAREAVQALFGRGTALAA